MEQRLKINTPYIGAIDNTNIFIITSPDGSFLPTPDLCVVPLIPKSVIASHISPELTLFLVLCENILAEEWVIAEYTAFDRQIDMTIWPIECFEILHNTFEKYIAKINGNACYAEVEN
jgi:hypothetical protein